MSTLNRASGTYDRHAETARINADWAESSRWQQVTRTHSADDVVRLRGSMKRDNMLARRGAEKLWDALTRPAQGDSLFIRAQEALTESEAIQQVKAGTQAITLSGREIAAVRRINSAFARADQIQWKAGQQPGSADYLDYFAPIVADADASFCGVLNGYELAQNLIRAGAAGVHFGDQLADQVDGTVLVSAQDAVQKLIAARLAADVEDAPTLIFARTNANTGELLLADCDACDQPFVVGERSSDDGFYCVKGGIELAIARGLTYAPYADVVWCETAQPDLAAAKQFAEAIRREYPDQLLAYSCSPSASHMNHLDDNATATFQRELAELGYTFQFIAAEQRRDQSAIDSRAA